MPGDGGGGGDGFVIGAMTVENVVASILKMVVILPPRSWLDKANSMNTKKKATNFLS